MAVRARRWLTIVASGTLLISLLSPDPAGARSGPSLPHARTVASVPGHDAVAGKAPADPTAGDDMADPASANWPDTKSAEVTVPDSTASFAKAQGMPFSVARAIGINGTASPGRVRVDLLDRAAVPRRGLAMRVSAVDGTGPVQVRVDYKAFADLYGEAGHRDYAWRPKTAVPGPNWPPPTTDPPGRSRRRSTRRRRGRSWRWPRRRPPAAATTRQRRCRRRPPGPPAGTRATSRGRTRCGCHRRWAVRCLASACRIRPRRPTGVPRPPTTSPHGSARASTTSPGRSAAATRRARMTVSPAWGTCAGARTTPR